RLPLRNKKPACVSERNPFMAPVAGGAAMAMLQLLLVTHLIVATCSSQQVQLVFHKLSIICI
uniref:Uncharacterized protein n=1 Tax=Aegilops tauschii subsp. strangulata TaxID=200361 RepID=A0A453JUV1_AEGTS